jgi:hypothetical protein
MIIKLQKENKCNNLKIKSIDEKRLKLLHHPIAILKIPIIHFPPKAPQEARGHHISHNNTPSATSSPSTSKQVNYSTWHNPREPKASLKNKKGEKRKEKKTTFYMAQATSQWRRRWSTESPFLLHIQHLSITMTCCFLRLSTVRISSRAINRTKKATLKETLVCQILFHGKRPPLLRTKTL